MSRHAVRQAERVKKADPRLFDQVHSGELPLREAERQVHAREAAGKLDDAVERYPFLRDVPGHSSARLLEVAATIDAAEDGERAALEDQARRWCEAQRELMPQWRAEDEVTRVVDGIITRLASVNTTLSRHGAAEMAGALTARIMPDNDIAIVRSALAHLSERGARASIHTAGRPRTGLPRRQAARRGCAARCGGSERRAGRADLEEFAGLVVAAPEARGGASAG